MQSTDHHVA